jgi:hypothetical protein
VHHAGKFDREGGDSILGSTALFAAVDTAIFLRRTERYRTVRSMQRYGEDLPETVLPFDPQTGLVSLGHTREQEEEGRIAEAIMDFLKARNEPATEAEIDAEVEGRTFRKRKALRDLISTGKVERSGKGGKNDPFHYAFKDSCSLVPIYMREQEPKKEGKPIENTALILVPDAREQESEKEG